MGVAIGYELREGNFFWTGESDLTAEQILAASDERGKSAMDEAIEFLKEELAGGPVKASEVAQDAHDMGVKDRTLYRAKTELRITSKRAGERGKRGGGSYLWQLPVDLDCQGSKLEANNQAQIELHCQNSLFGNVIPSGHVPNRHEFILGMLVARAIEIWHSESAPVIQLGPGENCLDLEELLSHPDVLDKHLVAVRQWLDSHDTVILPAGLERYTDSATERYFTPTKQTDDDWGEV